jgi:hypothetical protein
MRTENVEILSDKSNAAVLRHPDRVFPGVLVQGIVFISSATELTPLARKLGEARRAMMN